MPFFCKLEGGKPGKKGGSGGRLVFKPWAMMAMEKIAQMKDSRTVTFETIGKEGVYEYLVSAGVRVPVEDRRNAAMIVSKLYWFYKAWVSEGKPDINTIRITEMVQKYRDNLERGLINEDHDGSETADQD